MNKTMLSIIVPIYNTEKYLKECIDSILAQSFRKFELIMVDDGSTDSSGRIADEYATIDSRIVVIHKKNEGLVRARITGLERATGEYVGFVDSDDWIGHNHFTRLMESAISKGTDIVIGDNVVYRAGNISAVHQGIEYGYYNSEQIKDKLIPIMMFDKNMKLGISPSLCTKIIKRDILYKNQINVPVNLRLGEDAACFYPCLCAASSVEYISGCEDYFYRVYKESMSHTTRKIDTENRIDLVKHIHAMSTRYGDIEVQEGCRRYIFSTCISFLLQLFKRYTKYSDINRETEKLTKEEIVRDAIYSMNAQKLSWQNRILLNFLCYRTYPKYLVTRLYIIAKSIKKIIVGMR